MNEKPKSRLRTPRNRRTARKGGPTAGISAARSVFFRHQGTLGLFDGFQRLVRQVVNDVIVERVHDRELRDPRVQRENAVLGFG